MLDVMLLGGLRFRLNGKDIRFAGRPRVVPLLAYLLLNGRQPVARDSVAFALWPDESEDAARANLRRHLHYLRELLPRSYVPWFIVEGRTIYWNPAAPLRIDVIDFDRSAANPETLRNAVDVYGELLPGYDDEWLVVVRERLRQTYLRSLHELAQRARGRRDCAAAADYLARILTEDPWREDALRALMTVRCESGDRASALHLCRQFERRLSDEMGIALMPETAALCESIERGDPLPAVRLDATPREATMTFADLPFQGRGKEIERLRYVWERVLAGSGALTLVLGEAGIGKTRLAREFALDVEAGGGRVLWGTTSSPETVPYQAVVEVLRAALSFIKSLSLGSYELGILARLIPELRHEFQTDPGGEPDALKLFDVVGEVLGKIVRDRPTLVVLEDLHDAGPASIAMLEHIVQRCRGCPILILATSREEESVSAAVLSALRRPLPGGKPWVIALGPLSKRATRSIVTASLGSSAAAAWVTERCAGHPLFLAELLNAAADPQGLAMDALPMRLHQVINERMRRLSAEARMLLRAAAVVGTSFDLEIVAEILGWGEGPLAEAADELVARRIVRQRSDPRPFEYEFAHNLIAASVYESVPDRERRHCHRRAAHAAERWYGSRLTELSAFVANHFELGGAQDAAATYFLRAAQAASSSFANDEALAYARRGLELSSKSPNDRFDLSCVMEEVLERIGERATQRTVLRELDILAQRIGDPERMREVLRRRESLYRYLGESTAAREAIRRLKGLAAGNARWEAIALRDEAALQSFYSSHTEAYETITLAVQRAIEANDAAVLVSTLTLRAHLAASLDRQEEAMASLRSAKETAQRAESVILRMRVAYCEMTALTRFQAWSSIVEAAPQLLDLAAKCGSVETAAAAHVMLGSALGGLFKIAEARRHLNDAVEAYRRCDHDGLFVAYNNLATCELEVGRFDRAARALAAMETDLAQSESALGRTCVKIMACELAAHRGDYATAIELAEETTAAAHTLRDALFEGEALRCKGMALRESGRAREAVCVLEESLELHKRIALGLATKRAAAELSLACALAGDERAAPFADYALQLCSRDDPTADSPMVLWPLAHALQLLARDAQAHATLRRAHDAFVRRRNRLRSRRDRAAFTAQPSNTALIGAYSAASHTRPA